MMIETELEAKIKSNLDTNFLKLIAASTMLIDHIGYIFFPNIIWLRIIGRISFPLFAYCIVVGFLYTRDIIKYSMRLGIFSIISQPFYVLAFDVSWSELNIFPSLLMGLLMIYFLKEKKWISFIILIIIVSVGDFSYGIYGILLMVLLYIYRNNIYLSIIFSSVLLLQPFYTSFISEQKLNIQGFAILSIPLIYYRTNFNIKLNKYVFYAFYPVHLFILYLIKLLIL